VLLSGKTNSNVSSLTVLK